MGARITITPESLRGKRVYLLFTVDNDRDVVIDAILADELPSGTGDEFYKPVPHGVFMGIWANREKATLSFDDEGRLVSLV